MRIDKSNTVKLLQNRFNEILVPWEFRRQVGSFSWARDAGDITAGVSCWLQIDESRGHVILEAQVSSSSKQLLDEWLRIPGVENPNGLRAIGLGGHLNFLPQASQDIYAVTGIELESIDEMIERAANDLRCAGLRFFKEYDNARSIATAWAAEKHPFAKMDGYESMVVAASISILRDRESARRFASRMKARAALETQRAVRPVDIGAARKQLEVAETLCRYVDQREAPGAV